MFHAVCMYDESENKCCESGISHITVSSSLSDGQLTTSIVVNYIVNYFLKK